MTIWDAEKPGMVLDEERVVCLSFAPPCRVAGQDLLPEGVAAAGMD